MEPAIPPLLPSQFPSDLFRPEWIESDTFQLGHFVESVPDHHCKLGFQASAPFIRRRRRAVDIGCRDGEFTRYLQGAFEQVVCFDPRPRATFPVHVDTSRVVHYACALGDEPGEIVMYGGTHDPLFDKRGVYPCFRLDDFELTEVDYVKIDVEGFELKVLRGAEQLIDRDRPVIVIEQNDVVLAGEERFAAKRWLEERGYRHVATCPRGWDHVMAPV